VNDRRQIGPSLYFQTTQPAVGDRFRTVDGREVEVLDITPDPEDGGWLFTVEPSR
jgi:hypothetical protein